MSLSLSLPQRMKKVANIRAKMDEKKRQISTIMAKEQLVEHLVQRKVLPFPTLFANLSSLESERRLLMQEVFALEEHLEDQLAIMKLLAENS